MIDTPKRKFLEYIISFGHREWCESRKPDGQCDCHQEAAEDLLKYMSLPYGSVKEAEEMHGKWRDIL